MCACLWFWTLQPKAIRFKATDQPTCIKTSTRNLNVLTPVNLTLTPTFLVLICLPQKQTKAVIFGLCYVLKTNHDQINKTRRKINDKIFCKQQARSQKMVLIYLRLLSSCSVQSGHHKVKGRQAIVDTVHMPREITHCWTKQAVTACLSSDQLLIVYSTRIPRVFWYGQNMYQRLTNG